MKIYRDEWKYIAGAMVGFGLGLLFAVTLIVLIGG